jgi:hypothetical protein
MGIDEAAKVLPAKCLIEDEVPMNEAEIMKAFVRQHHNSLMFCQKLQELVEYNFAKIEGLTT